MMMENQKCNHRSDVSNNNNDFILHKIDSEKVVDAFVKKAAENVGVYAYHRRLSL